MAQKVAEYRATGRRKTSTARVRLAHGVGKVSVNGREFKDYFTTEALRTYIEQPFQATDTLKRYDVIAILNGGGINGQAGALRHGISRALISADAALRAALKAGGFLTRDPRMKERKKYGQPGARKRFQFSKR
ncbi:MAG TPA: 30S ribosomal protein S9 [Verrucomicrobia bacterium]|nr:MAG: 30S ribosomal protein S9 [Lentisphaerae bacterium GWF2_57_35]HBA84032.1 30S ribosomal protein S9 [Verrucomicrobiota bacterium]